MSKLNYRSDIDGLRGISIIGVLLYHFKFQLFSGGYLGVDVFLVISGFLITSFIVNKLKTGQFSLIEFLIRRAKRLLPSFLVVLFLSSIFAFILFLPDDLIKFAKSSISSITLTSNFYFWLNSGYWDESNTNPLLHTWSLSLEWQFYLIFSFSLFFIWKLFKNKFDIFIVPIFLVLFTLSLTIAILFESRGISFFLLPFRLYEFLIGSLIYFFINKKFTFLIKNKFFFSLLSIFLIVLSFIIFDSNSGAPSYISLMPCIATALLIYLKDTLVHKILKNRFIVYTGAISYSLYLFHWPVITFYSWINIIEIQLFIKILLIIISVVLAMINFETIEKTFRKKTISKKIIKLPLLLFCTLFVIFFSNIVINKKGFPNRVDKEKLVLVESISKFSQTKRENYLKDNMDLTFDKDKNIKILILGDSLGEDMFMAINQNINKKTTDVEFLTFSHWCFQDSKVRLFFPIFDRMQKRNYHCEKEIKYINENLHLLKNADFLILSNSWYEQIDLFIGEIVFFIKKNTKAKIIVSSKSEVFPRIPDLLKIIDIEELNNFNSIAYKARHKSTNKLNKRLKKKVEELGVDYLDRSKLICSDEKKICSILNEKQSKLYIVDNHHWSIEGAKYYGSKINLDIFNKN